MPTTTLHGWRSADALAEGNLDFVCAVDILNEGVDVPTVDRVVMLRPTESSVVFLQQLGRGLRVADDKDALAVIDFVGNHRIFLERLRWLLSIGLPDGVVSLQRFLDGQEPGLPEGCSGGRGRSSSAWMLYGWFGEDAGEPGTRHRVRFERAGDTWFARPVGSPIATDREEAIARMLGGEAYATACLQHARALIARNQMREEVSDWASAYLRRYPEAVVAAVVDELRTPENAAR